jgi:hypothetical protein
VNMMHCRAASMHQHLHTCCAAQQAYTMLCCIVNAVAHNKVLLTASVGCCQNKDASTAALPLRPHYREGRTRPPARKASEALVRADWLLREWISSTGRPMASKNSE